MKRRTFLRWFGLAPAAPLAVKAAESIGEALPRILEQPKPAAVPIMTSEAEPVECWTSVSAAPGFISWDDYQNR